MGQGLKKTARSTESQTISTTMFYHQGLIFLQSYFLKMVLSTLLILQHSIVIKYSRQMSKIAISHLPRQCSMFTNKLEAVLLHFCCLAHLETIHIYTPRCFCVIDVKEVTNTHVCTIQQNMNFPFFQIHSIPDGIVTLECHYIIVFPQNDTSG